MGLRSLGRLHSIPSDNDGVSQGWCTSLRGISSLYNVAHGRAKHSPAPYPLFVL